MSEIAEQNGQPVLRTETRGPGGRRTGNNRSLSGTFGDGSAVITATSFSGSVNVTKR